MVKVAPVGKQGICPVINLIISQFKQSGWYCLYYQINSYQKKKEESVSFSDLAGSQ